MTHRENVAALLNEAASGALFELSRVPRAVIAAHVPFNTLPDAMTPEGLVWTMALALTDKMRVERGESLKGICNHAPDDLCP